MKRFTRIAVLLVGLSVLVSGCNLEGSDSNQEAQPEPTVTVFVTPSPAPLPSPSIEYEEDDDAASCPDSWAIVQANHGDNHRWFAHGISAIRKAETKKEAREASKTWLKRVKKDPELLSGVLVYFLDREIASSKLRNGDCASEKAVQMVNAMKVALADARITSDTAPTTLVNSGVDDKGNAVSASVPGLSGDRRSLKIELRDRTLWILARCGQIGKEGKPSLPKGPTDQLPKKRPALSTTHLPVDEGGRGTGGVPEVKGENDGADSGTGCGGAAGQTPACDGEGTEPKPPKKDPPPKPEAPSPTPGPESDQDHEEKPENPW